nr:hypothetical protein [Tanacetum cinerariifolium]
TSEKTDPEQIFWSNDLIKLKSKALKEQTTVSRPIKVLTVITPTGLTEGERGFEQTKECYLKEVIPFFKTLKDNFEGVQKALTKEIKEIKDVFEELEAEVAQYAVDRKHDAIKRKNLLITNDKLIAKCLSKEVFSVATNSELNVAQFTEMTVSPTAVEARCSQKRDKQLAHIPLIRKKQVTFAKQSDKSDSNTHKHVVKVKTQKTNVPVPPSTGVNDFPNASGSQTKGNIKTNRISPANGVNKQPVEDQPRTNKSHLRTLNRVDSSSHLKRTVINSNSDSVCQTCNKCLTSSNHDMCVATYMQSVLGTPSIRHNCNVVCKVKHVWKPKQVR